MHKCIANCPPQEKVGVIFMEKEYPCQMCIIVTANIHILARIISRDEMFFIQNAILILLRAPFSSGNQGYQPEN